MAPLQLTIRDAQANDIGVIFDIYNHEVSHGTATFDTEPRIVGRDDAGLASVTASAIP